MSERVALPADAGKATRPCQYQPFACSCAQAPHGDP